MLLLITLYLSISAGSTPQPALPPWPTKLPSPVAASCGECLPPQLADAVHYRLEACEHLDSRWRTHEDGLRDVLRAECDVRVVQARIAMPAPASPWWRDVLLVGGGVIAGGLAVALGVAVRG